MNPKSRPDTTPTQQGAAQDLIDRLRQPLLDAGLSEFAPIIRGDELLIADGDMRFAHVVPDIQARQPEAAWLRQTLHRLGIRGIKIGVRGPMVYASFSVKRNRTWETKHVEI